MNKVKKLTSWSAFPALALLIIFLIVNAIINNGLSSSFFRSFISTNTGAICLAVGVTAAILTGGIDISLGSIVSLVNVVIVTLNGKGLPVWQAALIGLLVALACGMFNGFLVGVMRITPLLTTFATSTAYAGIALWILPYPGGSIDFALFDWYNADLFGFIPTPVYMIAILCIIWVIFQKLPSGTHLYAVGQNAQKAYASGINVYGIKFFVHTYAGLAAGIAGLCMSANICAGSPTIGSTMGMNSIAAAVIGGVSLNGGKGNIWGPIFGACFLNILISIVVSANLSSYVQSFVQGLILLIGIIFSVVASDEDLKAKVFGKKRGA